MATLSGGDKLEKVLAKIGSNAKGGLSVGFLSGATYTESGTPVAQVAFWNEFGHGGRFPAPPRPFFRNMISSESGAWPVRLAKALKYYDYNAKAALGAMGENIKDALQESIMTFSGAELSETTKILRSKFGNNPQEITLKDVLAAQQDAASGEKGASGTQAKPLIWTGHMKDSVDYEVKE